MRYHTIYACLLGITLTCLNAQTPTVLGKGAGLFEIGPEIARDDFGNLDNWVVQVQPSEKAPPHKVAVKDNTLDCYLPNRGCTIWFKEKLKTRVTISYDVLCPTPEAQDKNFIPRDINNFWMASDPGGKLFDSERFTGDFGTYHKMHGYYASTGGGRNTTARMRRYPRAINEIPVEHLALTSRDKDPEFLITPDKVMHVQLVAYDDLIQYIVDGKLVYEISHGDKVQFEGNKRVMREGVYDSEQYPAYKEGHFGFRMVGTHHIYSKFRVHALQPASQKITVDSIEKLREVMTKSNQEVVMKPCTYKMPNFINGRIGIEMSGSHNSLDLT